MIPVTTEEYGVSKVKRLKNSRRSKVKIKNNLQCKITDWRDTIGKYIGEKNGQCKH